MYQYYTCFNQVLVSAIFSVWIIWIIRFNKGKRMDLYIMTFDQVITWCSAPRVLNHELRIHKPTTLPFLAIRAGVNEMKG